LENSEFKLSKETTKKLRKGKKYIFIAALSSGQKRKPGRPKKAGPALSLI
jgi:hypothetical protein